MTLQPHLKMNSAYKPFMKLTAAIVAAAFLVTGTVPIGDCPRENRGMLAPASRVPQVKILKGGKPGVEAEDDAELALLDENGGWLEGSKKKSGVHRDGDWHATVHVYIFDKDGRVLLQRRSQKKKASGGRLEASLGGHVNANESVSEAALREAKEELGISLSPKRLHRVSKINGIKRSYPSKAGQNNEFSTVFFYRMTDKEEADIERNYNLNEVEELMLVPPSIFEAMVRENPDAFTHGIQYFLNEQRSLFERLVFRSRCELFEATLDDLDRARAVHNKRWWDDFKNEYLRFSPDQMQRLIDRKPEEQKLVYLLKIRGADNPISGVLCIYLVRTEGDIFRLGIEKVSDAEGRMEHQLVKPLWAKMKNGEVDEKDPDTVLFWSITALKPEDISGVDVPKGVNLAEIFVEEAKGFFGERFRCVATFSPVNEKGFNRFLDEIKNKKIPRQIMAYAKYLYLLCFSRDGYERFFRAIRGAGLLFDIRGFVREGEDDERMADYAADLHVRKGGATIAMILPRRDGCTRPDGIFTSIYAYQGFKAFVKPFRHVQGIVKHLIETGAWPKGSGVMSLLVREAIDKLIEEGRIPNEHWTEAKIAEIAERFSPYRTKIPDNEILEMIKDYCAGLPDASLGLSAALESIRVSNLSPGSRFDVTAEALRLHREVLGTRRGVGRFRKTIYGDLANLIFEDLRSSIRVNWKRAPYAGLEETFDNVLRHFAEMLALKKMPPDPQTDKAVLVAIGEFILNELLVFSSKKFRPTQCEQLLKLTTTEEVEDFLTYVHRRKIIEASGNYLRWQRFKKRIKDGNRELIDEREGELASLRGRLDAAFENIERLAPVPSIDRHTLIEMEWIIRRALESDSDANAEKIQRILADKGFVSSIRHVIEVIRLIKTGRANLNVYPTPAPQRSDPTVFLLLLSLSSFVLMGASGGSPVLAAATVAGVVLSAAALGLRPISGIGWDDRLERAKAILGRLNGGGLCRVLSESGVIFARVNTEDSDVLYGLLNTKNTRIAEIDRAFFEKDAPDAALVIVLLYMAIDLQNRIGNGGRYLEVVEGRRKDKEELAGLLFNGNGTNKTLAKWALDKRDKDGDDRFVGFLVRTYADLAEATHNVNERIEEQIKAAKGSMEGREGLLRGRDFAGLLHMLRALIFYLHKNEPDLYKKIIKGYPALPAVTRHRDPGKAKKDVRVLRAFGTNPRSSLDEIAAATGACGDKKFSQYSHILVDTLMQDPILRERIKDIIFEKNKLLPPLKISSEELPLAAWTLYHMTRSKSRSERIRDLIRLYPALFNSRSGGLAFALRCQEILEMIIDGNGLSRIRERLPFPKKTVAHTIQVSLENALRFPEVREEFLRMKDLMDTPNKWPENERLSIRGMVIRYVLRNMEKKEFSRLLEDFHMLPDLQRLYTPAEVRRQEKALFYIREGGVKRERVRFRGTELLADVMRFAIRNAEKHPLMLEAIERRRASQEVAFTEWDKRMVFRILRRLDRRKFGLLLRQYPSLHAKAMRLFPKLLKKGYMNRKKTDEMLIGLLHDGLGYAAMIQMVEEGRMAQGVVIDEDLRRLAPF